jgi:hypothetical protein
MQAKSKYENIKERICELNNLPLFVYEQNRQIKHLKNVWVEETREYLEINDEYMLKYDIDKKYTEFLNTNSNYDCNHYVNKINFVLPSDPYLKAFLFHFNINLENKNYIKESLERMNTFCNYYEYEKQNNITKLLGNDANESNYIALINNKVEKYYKELDDVPYYPMNGVTIDYDKHNKQYTIKNYPYYKY